MSSLEVVFCDNHLLIAVKPAGMSTQPHFVECAKAWVKQKFAKPGNVFLEPVHRLDRPVAGLVLFARTSKALSRLQEFMRERQIKKTYRAHIEKALSEPQGTLEDYLYHADHKAKIVSSNHLEAKQAILHYTTVATHPTHTELELILETGRYHQIRAQLAHRGCPILGDIKYGSTRPWPHEGIALVHAQLSFSHPITKEPLHFLWACKGLFARNL